MKYSLLTSLVLLTACFETESHETAQPDASVDDPVEFADASVPPGDAAFIGDAAPAADAAPIGDGRGWPETLESCLLAGGQLVEQRVFSGAIIDDASGTSHAIGNLQALILSPSDTELAVVDEAQNVLRFRYGVESGALKLQYLGAGTFPGKFLQARFEDDELFVLTEVGVALWRAGTVPSMQTLSMPTSPTELATVRANPRLNRIAFVADDGRIGITGFEGETSFIEPNMDTPMGVDFLDNGNIVVAGTTGTGEDALAVIETLYSPEPVISLERTEFEADFLYDVSGRLSLNVSSRSISFGLRLFTPTLQPISGPLSITGLPGYQTLSAGGGVIYAEESSSVVSAWRSDTQSVLRGVEAGVVIDRNFADSTGRFLFVGGGYDGVDDEWNNETHGRLTVFRCEAP